MRRSVGNTQVMEAHRNEHYKLARRYTIRYAFAFKKAERGGTPFPSMPNKGSLMEYAEAVRIGKKLVHKTDVIAWEIGDLLLELVPQAADPHGGAVTGMKALVTQWKEDVDAPWAYSTLMGFRVAAMRWPKDKREPNASFAVHRLLAANPDRFELIKPHMSQLEAKRVMGYKFNHSEASIYATTPAELLKASNSFLRTMLKKMPKSPTSEELEIYGELLAEADSLRDELAAALDMVVAA